MGAGGRPQPADAEGAEPRGAGRGGTAGKETLVRPAHLGARVVDPADAVRLGGGPAALGTRKHDRVGRTEIRAAQTTARRGPATTAASIIRSGRILWPKIAVRKRKPKSPRKRNKGGAG